MTRRLVSFAEFVDAILLHGKDVDGFIVLSCTPDQTAEAGRVLQEVVAEADPGANATVARRIAKVAPMLEERQIAVAVGAHLRRLRPKESPV